MKILFICEGNMMRSQIAEALYNSRTDSHNATSAGVNAFGADTPSRRATAVMDEINISLDGHYSKQLTPEMVARADKIILFDVSEEPDYLATSKKLERWSVADLGYGKDDITLDCQVRDDIRARVQELIGD